MALPDKPIRKISQFTQSKTFEQCDCWTNHGTWLDSVQFTIHHEGQDYKLLATMTKKLSNGSAHVQPVTPWFWHDLEFDQRHNGRFSSNVEGMLDNY